jgi:hypothetical protein
MLYEKEQEHLVFNAMVALEMALDFFRSAERLQTPERQLHKSFKQSFHQIESSGQRIKAFVRQSPLASATSFGLTADYMREVMVELSELAVDSERDEVIAEIAKRPKKYELSRKAMLR